MIFFCVVAYSVVSLVLNYYTQHFEGDAFLITKPSRVGAAVDQAKETSSSHADCLFDQLDFSPFLCTDWRARAPPFLSSGEV
jgi:hypothetical protein